MSEELTQKAAFTPAHHLSQPDDWRPIYFFSPAAQLPRLAKDWPQLKDCDVEVVDGWRFSDNPESDWYLQNVALRDPIRRDPITGERARIDAGPKNTELAERYRTAIEGEFCYRMRHIDAIELQPETQQMQPPAIEGESFCLAEGDILVRRVGAAAAALATAYHRKHPIDANIAIIRGLAGRNALWLTYCLNQPLYREYLEQQFGTTSLVRVGLKHLRSVPVAPLPVEFTRLADQFLAHYQAKTEAEDRLFQLRQRVSRFVQNKLPTQTQYANRWDFFEPQDVSDVLSHSAASQGHFARLALATGEFVHLGELAHAPAQASSSSVTGTTKSSPRVLRIGDVDAQLCANINEANTEHSWRFHGRPLSTYDVVISTFVVSPKVGIVIEDTVQPVYPTEQLAVLNFNQYPGAYALVMELPFVTQQLEQLATGMVQRFIHPRQLKNIVLPRIDRETAMQWHEQLTDILRTRQQHRKEIHKLLLQMQPVFDKAHALGKQNKEEQAA